MKNFLFSAGVVPYLIKGNNTILFLLLHYEAGHWDFPKGKIEEGESKKEAALRELKEETGIEVDITSGFEETFSFFYRDQDKILTKKTVYFYMGRAKSEKITLSHEHKNYAWLPYEKALEQLTFDNAKDLLKKVYTVIQKRR